MSIDRMPGRVRPSWCPSCHGPPGPDCYDVGRSGRWVRRDLDRRLRREVVEALDDRRWERRYPGQW